MHHGPWSPGNKVPVPPVRFAVRRTAVVTGKHAPDKLGNEDGDSGGKLFLLLYLDRLRMLLGAKASLFIGMTVAIALPLFDTSFSYCALRRVCFYFGNPNSKVTIGVSRAEIVDFKPDLAPKISKRIVTFRSDLGP